EGREAPGRVVHPGPAPGRDPHPVAVAVRRPSGDRGVREPHRAVFGNRPPAAVFIEILVAHHVVRHVAGRLRALPPRIAVAAPAVEIVVARIAFDVGAQLVGAFKRRGLSGVNRIGGTAAGNLALPVADVDDRGVAVFVDADAIGAGTEYV